MSAPLSPEREAKIRTDLDAIPAPPWRWIGSRHAGGPQLVTDHSGRQYVLRAAKPTDHRGDELLDPETYSVVYGDLEFRDQREGERYSTMRSGDALAIGRTEYDPDSIVGVANPVAHWLEASAQYATELLAEVDRLRVELDEAQRRYVFDTAELKRTVEYFDEQSKRRKAELAALPAPVVETAFRDALGNVWPLGHFPAEIEAQVLETTPTIQRTVRISEWTEVAS
ncbi:hypothetical protein [Streptomyces sp. ok210]|uniref:hypothetical protein n=1 Tax=Streptomyces sp. ok210 TaxID=1761905 RepID=UPI0008E1A90E|nr:hypothetical protein [Streptomyces sp. ok210]SFT31874.1 hypothetical protein SAMN04487982_12490 [Streptomyces sp. ok210]